MYQILPRSDNFFHMVTVVPCPTLEVTEVTTVQCCWKTELHSHASTLAFGDEQQELRVDDPQL